MMIDPAWEGTVQFYELIFGTWLSYIFLVVLWEKILKAPLDEWRYVLINFIGAGAFWVNHYFQNADFWMTLLNLYTLWFFIAWYLFAVRPHKRSKVWQVGVTLGGGLAYTIAFICFENIARYGVDQLEFPEFLFMFISYFGLTGVILWRGRAAQ
ncbi:MAG: hypothetical protein GY727_00245 [Gammaproteobacteria bacterium]|nr:hypothetical protein [Gammaproteobacteria bacterium]MCP4091017.1 hypothetical protein [Gammaproteobacteria bacterium]MCP4277457.1 hypothetical protein [Gammaproteobacteria bacterium]MCP4831482.1 hypothetical protein [Gammaproteobacteria bacterium]MCP4927705.1 hypothetical protein [Gammaproteobacteria bacterium]